MDDKSLENTISIPSCARGLRIFVVDPDTSSLLHTAAILEEQSYKVTTIELPNIALSLIQEKENQYDLIIAEVDTPEMDGFTFLKHIIHETDIPIILMSKKANLEMAKRALEEGACFFWTKPLRVKDLINVWQHIFHNKVKAKLERVNKRKLTFQEEESFTEKNKRSCSQVNMEEKKKEEDEFHINNLEQKQRLIWTPQLHLKFLQAVDALGGEKIAQPNALLKLMDVPNLTHRHVASHLQKYRLRLMRNSGTSSQLGKPFYKLQNKMDFPLTNCNIPTTSKSQANVECSSNYDTDNIKEIPKDVNSCSSIMIKTTCPNEDTFVDTFVGESNSRSTNSSCDIGIVNFQEGNYYSQGLERQDQFFGEQFENQNNLVEYFEHEPNLEVNNGTMDNLSSLGNISMSVTEIMKILEED